MQVVFDRSPWEIPPSARKNLRDSFACAADYDFVQAMRDQID
jgi:hypothetical protein